MEMVSLGHPSIQDVLTPVRCFWINVPIGAFTIFVIAVFLPPSKIEEAGNLTWQQQIARLDIGGTVLFLPAVVCLLLALDLGGNQYGWSNARVVFLLIFFVVLILCFVAYEAWMKEDAAVPLRVVGLKNVAFGSWFVFGLDGTFYVFDYYVSS